MKRLLLLFIALPVLCISQQTYVPDDNFEQALINLGLDNVLDNYVTTANINTVTFLNVYNQNIADLTGLESFTALDWLDCLKNQLTSLDISNNTALTKLRCNDNQLTSLDVSNNTALIWLSCPYNQLTSLDVSNNTALTDLWFHNNQFTSLDISNNTSLTSLYCDDNQFTSLDLSNNTSLTRLNCSGNQLTSLDISNNTALTYLKSYNNPLFSLDVSNNTALEYLWCNHNQLTSLDVSNNTALLELYCNNNQLTCLNIKNGNNTNFQTLYAYYNLYLSCIQVDDTAWSTANWTVANFNIDTGVTFSTNCNYLANCFSTSIQENTSNTTLFPNPTGDIITLDINGYNGSIQTQVYDLSGRLLKTTNNTTISLKNYAKGIYIFRAAYGDIVEELKVVKE